MDEAKRAEAKAIIISRWDDFADKTKLAKHVMEGYIFGPYGDSEHYNIDLFSDLVKEVELEKAPTILEG